MGVSLSASALPVHVAVTPVGPTGAPRPQASACRLGALAARAAIEASAAARILDWVRMLVR
jgi:hypothetical protein